MKRNLIFISILTFLITFAYIYEEKSKGKLREEFEKRNVLMSINEYGELKSFTNTKLTIDLSHKNPYVVGSKSLVNRKNLRVFFDFLGSMIVIRKIEQAEIYKAGYHHFFKNDDMKIKFQFEKNTITFILGKKINFNKSFYVKIIDGSKTTFVEAAGKNLAKGFYFKKDKHRSNLDYEKFKTFFYIGEDFFLDKRIFRKMISMNKKSNEFKKIKIFDKKNSFEVNYNNMTTKPPPFGNLGYAHKEFEIFKNYLFNLSSVKYYYKYRKKILKTLLKTIEITTEDEKFVLKLYRRYGSLRGFFVIVNNEPYLYELNNELRGIFFQKEQYFWKLRLRKNPLILKEFLFSKNNQSTKVMVEKLTPYFVVGDQTPLNKPFLKLKRMFSARAIRVKKYLKNPREFFDIIANGQIFRVTKTKNENIIIDLKNLTQYHYLIEEHGEISLNWKDYFL